MTVPYIGDGECQAKMQASQRYSLQPLVLMHVSSQEVCLAFKSPLNMRDQDLPVGRFWSA